MRARQTLEPWICPWGVGVCLWGPKLYGMKGKNIAIIANQFHWSLTFCSSHAAELLAALLCSLEISWAVWSFLFVRGQNSSRDVKKHPVIWLIKDSSLTNRHFPFDSQLGQCGWILPPSSYSCTVSFVWYPDLSTEASFTSAREGSFCIPLSRELSG